MNKLTALIEAAKAATPGPWRTGNSGTIGLLAHYVPRSGSWASILCCEEEDCGGDVRANTNPADLTFVALANPATILELCALLEKAEEALALLHKNIPYLRCDNFHHAKKDQHDTEETCPPLARHCYAEQCTVEVLAAIKQWKEQK